MKKNKSFTLIELLVVIALIGLLSSIVLVSVSKVREKARISAGLKFMSNLDHSLMPVGKWGFDGNTDDGSGYGNDGDLNCVGGGCYGNENECMQGQCLKFNGNDYVEIPYNSSLYLAGNNETVALWVKHNNSSNILFQAAGWSRRLWGTTWTLIDKNGTYRTLSAAGSNDNKWHLVAYTVSNGIIKSYVDGKLVETEASADIKPASSYWRFGRVCGGSTCDRYYTGLIDEVRIYEESLTSTQIEKIYVEGLERHKNLVNK